MSRPAVSVVMPFAGSAAAAKQAMAALRSLRIQPGDELILADNVGVAPAAEDVHVVQTGTERSPAHARNTGAEQATCEWILFLDADCVPRSDLLDTYFAVGVAEDVGALVGEVEPAPGTETLAGRYGAERSFLSQRAHLEHPFKPRAAAANLLVRRSAFVEVGGFYEGVRAAEDTDFTWRLQELGWRLELRSDASVEHHYRATVSDLRRQWRGYAAGRAWLARRYAGFRPEPALRRAARRASRAGRRTERRSAATAEPAAAPPSAAAPSRERWRFLGLDALLSVEELAGFVLSNRPRIVRRPTSVDAVLIAERFPSLGDPLVELARTFGQVRIEAAARPRHTDVTAARALMIDYREDDGVAERFAALSRLAMWHPVRVLRDLVTQAPGQPSLLALAPTVRRVGRDSRARVLPLGSADSQGTAERVARLAGRPLSSPALVPGRRGPDRLRSRRT